MRTSNVQRPTSNFQVQNNARAYLKVGRWTLGVGRSIFALQLLLSSLCQAATPATHPSTLPVAQPTASNLQLHETAVFVLDASTGQLNPDGIITATLPAFVIDHRYGSVSNPTPVVNNNQFGNNFMFFNGRMIRMGGMVGGGGESDSKKSDTTKLPDDPLPIGIIRLIGSADSKVDVSITTKGGNFVGSWPKAEDRPNQLLWRDLTVSDQADVPPAVVAVENWFAKLRNDPSAFVQIAHEPAEKFLLYDLQMKYDSHLKIKAGKDDEVEIKNTGDFPLHDVVIYRDGLQALVGDMSVAGKAVKPATPVASTAPTTRSATATASPAVDTSIAAVKLVGVPSTQPSLPSLPWDKRMQAAHVEQADREVVDRLLSHYAHDQRTTAVYAMDDAEMDKLLPLEVVPQPAKISRFGLMIVINADPSSGNLVDDLIKQLGDDDWAKRDNAYHALAAMGPAATAKLQTASKDKDLEIAWRAERLLTMILPPKPQ